MSITLLFRCVNGNQYFPVNGAAEAITRCRRDGQKYLDTEDVELLADNFKVHVEQPTWHTVAWS